MTESQPAHVLIVDDDGASRFLMSQALRRVGYAVSESVGGQQALEQISQHEFDLALVEIQMAGMDGLELLRRIKHRRPEVVVVLMTATASFETAVEALRLDACDYLVKPCSSQAVRASVGRGIERARGLKQRRRLLEAVKRDVLELAGEDLDSAQAPRPTQPQGQVSPYRERIPKPSGATFRLGPLAVFPGRHQIAVGDKSVSLTPTEFGLLLYLAAHSGRIVSCHELVREVRGYAVAEAEAREVIRPHVSNLRGKLQSIGEAADLVVNVRGVGYRLNESAEAG